jgi:hypothetical protein
VAVADRSAYVWMNGMTVQGILLYPWGRRVRFQGYLDRKVCRVRGQGLQMAACKLGIRGS